MTVEANPSPRATQVAARARRLALRITTGSALLIGGNPNQRLGASFPGRGPLHLSDLGGSTAASEVRAQPCGTGGGAHDRA